RDSPKRLLASFTDAPLASNVSFGNALSIQDAPNARSLRYHRSIFSARQPLSLPAFSRNRLVQVSRARAKDLTLPNRERAGVPARAARVGWRLRPASYLIRTLSTNKGRSLPLAVL